MQEVFFLASVGRNRPEAETRRAARLRSHNREHKLQLETAQEKPLAPKVKKGGYVHWIFLWGGGGRPF